jgi:regulator of sirC expression with transglutaminase-like and TPR domain
MRFKLLEDNKNIEGYVEYLDNLIIKLKASNKLKYDDPLYKELISTNNKIASWVKNYILLNKEIDPKDEEIMINAILDRVNSINKILNNGSI